MTEKQATKLMSECSNVFDDFIKKFFIKFDKLQIEGFHTKRAIDGSIIGVASAQKQPRQYFSVSPGKQRLVSLNNIAAVTRGFNVHPAIMAKHGYGTSTHAEMQITTGGGMAASTAQSDKRNSSSGGKGHRRK